MNLESQAQALLDLVEADRARQVAAILGEARGRAAALHAQAHADARKRMREAFAEQRALHRERIAAAMARLATQRRLHEQQRTAALLQRAWERLPGELLQRWRDPAARAAWVAKVIAAAKTRMPRGPWHIVHAPDWPAAEQQALRPSVAGGAGRGAGIRARRADPCRAEGRGRRQPDRRHARRAARRPRRARIAPAAATGVRDS